MDAKFLDEILENELRHSTMMKVSLFQEDAFGWTFEKWIHQYKLMKVSTFTEYGENYMIILIDTRKTFTIVNAIYDFKVKKKHLSELAI